MKSNDSIHVQKADNGFVVFANLSKQETITKVFLTIDEVVAFVKEIMTEV